MNKFILIILCLILTSCSSLRDPTDEELDKFKKESDCSDLRTMVEETILNF